MAGTIIVSSIKTDTDNSFIVRSNTGATLFSVDTTSISIPDGSITSAMIANGTVIAADVADGSITDAKIAAVANTKITGLVTAAQIANVANTQVTGLITSGQIASVANTQITGNITQSQIATGVGGTGPAFSAYSNTLTSVTNTTFTKVTFNIEEFDTNSNFASSRFTPTVAGYYQINACISGPGSGTGIMLANIFKNGSNFKSGNQIPNNAAGTYVIATALIYLNGSTDYVEIYAYQNTGGTVNLGSNSVDFAFSGSLARSA